MLSRAEAKVRVKVKVRVRVRVKVRVKDRVRDRARARAVEVVAAGKALVGAAGQGQPPAAREPARWEAALGITILYVIQLDLRFLIRLRRAWATR
jgi:hypothetical protein